MQEFTTKMNENGRLVIPAACREALNLIPGEEIILCLENHELRLYTRKQALDSLKSMVQKKVKSKKLASQLIAERRKAARDE